MIYRKTSAWVKNIAKRRGAGDGVRDECSAYLAVTAAMAALRLNKKTAFLTQMFFRSFSYNAI